MSNIIGIDVGKMSLDCAWLRDLDQDKPKRKKVENSPQGFKSMLTWAQDVSGLAASELSFMVEPTGIYHEFLVQFRESAPGNDLRWLTRPWSGSSPRAWAF